MSAATRDRQARMDPDAALSALNNLGRAEVSQDFEDRRHADRKPLTETEV